MAKPCGCGSAKGGRAPTDPSGAKTGYSVPVGRNGVTELSQYPGDFQPYTGKQRHTSVFVVGLPSPEPGHERIFLRKNSKEAIAYARETGQRLHHLPASQLPHQAMVDLFGE
jgi:hypothetical protein